MLCVPCFYRFPQVTGIYSHSTSTWIDCTRFLADGLGSQCTNNCHAVQFRWPGLLKPCFWDTKSSSKKCQLQLSFIIPHLFRYNPPLNLNCIHVSALMQFIFLLKMLRRVSVFFVNRFTSHKIVPILIQLLFWGGGGGFCGATAQLRPRPPHCWGF
jgi:hypothetical protein